ncbi:MAG: glycosyltransferase [Planctomycetes bacterium]|nr:glycosyltransferase [Planctomycetota bacterium]
MPQRRIALVTATLDRAGTEKQLTLLATGLTRSMGFQPVMPGFAHEFDIHVLALQRGGPYEAVLRAAGIPVTVLGQRGRFDPLAFWRAKQWLKHLAPELVHTWGPLANTTGRAAALAAKVRKIAAGERCIDPQKSEVQWQIDRWLARHTTHIVAVSTDVRDFCIAGGLPAEKFVVIPNGVPSASGGRKPPVASAPNKRTSLLAELSIPPDARLIASVGPLNLHKRIKDVIWAADLLKVIRDDVHLLILGEGPHRHALMHYRDQVEIRDRVHFLGHREDAAAILDHCDLLWHASSYEGQPNAVMEALAAGIPVVATDIPGVRELVTNSQHGFLVPVGDRAALARYANKLLDDTELRARLGAAGRERMQREFSCEAMVHRYTSLYRELLQ